MAKGVNIPIAADASTVVREGKKVEGALEDVIDSLDDIGTASKDTARDSEKALESIGDEAEQSGDRLEKSFRESFKKVEKAAKTEGKEAGRALAKGVKDGADDKPLTGKDVFKADLKAELVSNAAEAGGEAARGLKDGFDTEDMSTILDGVSDTIVQVGVLGGPIGTAAGLAASSAMQLLVGPVLEDAKANAEQFQATFTDAFDNIVAEGEAMGRELTISATVEQYAKDAEKFKTATDIAARSGVDAGLVLRAMAGDIEALELVQQSYTKSIDEETKTRDDLEKRRGTSREGSAAEYQDLAALSSRNRTLKEAMQEVNSEHANNTKAADAGAKAAKAFGDAQNWAAEKSIANAQAMAKATGKSQELEVTIDGVTQALKVMPSGKVVEVTDDGTSEKTQAQIDAISGGEVKMNVTANTSGLVTQIQNQLTGKTVHINVQPRVGVPVVT